MTSIAPTVTTTFTSERDPAVSGAAPGSVDVSVSEDRRAFTITFSDAVVQIGGGSSDALKARVVGVVVPINDATPESTITFSIQGFAATTAGGSATLWLRAGERVSKQVSIPGERNSAYVEQLTYVPTPGELEVHLVIVMVGEGPDARAVHLGVQTYLSVDAIDAEISAPPQRRAANR